MNHDTSFLLTQRVCALPHMSDVEFLQVSDPSSPRHLALPSIPVLAHINPGGICYVTPGRRQGSSRTCIQLQIWP